MYKAACRKVECITRQYYKARHSISFESWKSLRNEFLCILYIIRKAALANCMYESFYFRPGAYSRIQVYEAYT